jgi:hypothetical protein
MGISGDASGSAVPSGTLSAWAIAYTAAPAISAVAALGGSVGEAAVAAVSGAEAAVAANRIGASGFATRAAHASVRAREDPVAAILAVRAIVALHGNAGIAAVPTVAGRVVTTVLAFGREAMHRD